MSYLKLIKGIVEENRNPEKNPVFYDRFSSKTRKTGRNSYVYIIRLAIYQIKDIDEYNRNSKKNPVFNDRFSGKTGKTGINGYGYIIKACHISN